MLKKPIEYVDYNGQPRKEFHYFNLTQAEVIELQMGIKGGLVEYLRQAIKDENSPVIMDTIKKIIRKSYGEKGADGKSFIKHKIVDGVRVELADLFEQTPAYSELFVELLTKDNASDEFLRGIIPEDMSKNLPANTVDALPDDIKEVLPDEVLAAQN